MRVPLADDTSEEQTITGESIIDRENNGTLSNGSSSGESGANPTNGSSSRDTTTNSSSSSSSSPESSETPDDSRSSSRSSSSSGSSSTASSTPSSPANQTTDDDDLTVGASGNATEGHGGRRMQLTTRAAPPATHGKVEWGVPHKSHEDSTKAANSATHRKVGRGLLHWSHEISDEKRREYRAAIGDERNVRHLQGEGEGKKAEAAGGPDVPTLEITLKVKWRACVLRGPTGVVKVSPCARLS